MFTGLVERIGTITRRTGSGSGARLAVSTDLGAGEPLVLGESIAVSGACLTVARRDAEGFEADLSGETLLRTTLGERGPGDPVNLERALAVGDRLGGHLVSGHVDGIGTIRVALAEGESARVAIEAPEELLRFVAEKGSITVDGVSLTVNRVEGAVLELMIVPHTRSVTTLGSLAPGRRVNLEVDLVARHVVRYLEATRSPGPGLEDALRKAGFLG